MKKRCMTTQLMHRPAFLLVLPMLWLLGCLSKEVKGVSEAERLQFIGDCKANIDSMNAAGLVEVDEEPQVILMPKPKYPVGARGTGQQGQVLIQSLVCQNGYVRKAIVGKTSHFPLLDSAAVKHAYACKYKPAIKDNQPIAMWVSYSVDYRLND